MIEDEYEEGFCENCCKDVVFTRLGECPYCGRDLRFDLAINSENEEE